MIETKHEIDHIKITVLLKQNKYIYINWIIFI